MYLLNHQHWSDSQVAMMPPCTCLQCELSTQKSRSSTNRQSIPCCAILITFLAPQSLLPGLASLSSGWTWSIRCWTYWSGPGFMSPTGPHAQPSGSGQRSDIYLGGRQVWSSAWPGVNASVPAAHLLGASTAPVITDLGSSAQLLAVEWSNVTAIDYLILSDGADIVQIDPSRMFLPVACAQVPGAAGGQPVGGVTVGDTGHFSLTLLPDIDDIPTLTSGLV